MKIFKYFVVITTVLMAFHGCQKENLVNNLPPKDEICTNEIPYYSSITEATTTYKQIKNKNESLLSDSFTSRFDAIKQTKIKEFDSQNLKSAISNFEEIIDVEDSIIADPVILKMVNENREVQIGNQIYKITQFGTFICDQTEINPLRAYLEKQDFIFQITDLIRQLKEGNKIGIETNDGVCIDVRDKIQLFIDTKNKISSSFHNNKSAAISVGAIMNECNESNKTWGGELLAGLTGYHVNCENNFSSSKRVKTIFWAQNFFWVGSVGVKVKMQKKTLGIWWKEQADELMLGWDKITYETTYNLSGNSININYNNKHFNNSTDLYEELMQTQYKEWRYVNLPEYNTPLLNLIWFTDIDDDVNRLAYRLAVNYLKNQVKTIINQLNGPSSDHLQLTLVQPNNKITVVIMPQDPAIHSFNQVDEEVLFAQNYGTFVFGASFNSGGAMDPVIHIEETLATYQVEEGSSMFGIARENGEWRGSRIVK